MSEILTIEAIEARHPNEWVLIGEPDLSEFGQLVSGRVLAHDSDRDVIHAKMLELRLPRCAIRCFGELPEDTVLIL